MGFELVHHVMDQAGGNGEADADTATRRRKDHRVHANHLTTQVKGGSARIAPVDGRIDLDEVGVLLAALDIATQGRDDTGGHRIEETEWGAGCNSPASHAEVVVVVLP
jgi:hypothetical protein